jgi:Uma2 family endonuclease
MTYEAFLDWADEDTRAEWVNGDVVMTSPANLRHQDLDRFLLNLLTLFVEARHLGTIIGPPFQMKLSSSGREPDILFVTTSHLDRLRETFLDGPADLVVEIVSDDSATRDRVVKRQEYEEGGVLEYWLLDPRTQRARFFHAEIPGKFQEMHPDAEGMYRSAVLPGFWLRIDWLWQDPLPGALGTALEIDRAAFSRYFEQE